MLTDVGTIVISSEVKMPPLRIYMLESTVLHDVSEEFTIIPLLRRESRLSLYP